MRNLLASFALALLLAVPVNAQKPRPMPPPPIMRIPPPVVRAPPAPQPICNSPARVRFSEQALCIVNRGGFPVVWQVGRNPMPVEEVDLDLALSMLADRDFEPFWPELEVILGSDGTALRDRLLEASARAMANGQTLRPARATVEALNQGRIRAILDHANMLTTLGREQEAITLLTGAAEAEVAARRLRGANGFDWVSLMLRRAFAQTAARDYPAAEATWRAIETREEVDSDYRINAMVNRAALLAEQGRAAEALQLIDAAIAQFDDASDEAIGGSDRQFAWIRACALHHLGREQEAQQALAPLRMAPARVQTWTLVPVTSRIELRAAFCMRDTDWAVQLIEESNAPFPMLWQITQPGFTSSQPGWEEQAPVVRARLAAGTALRDVRELPPPYQRAIGRWRSNGDTVTAPQ